MKTGVVGLVVALALSGCAVYTTPGYVYYQHPTPVPVYRVRPSVTYYYYAEPPVQFRLNANIRIR